MYNTRKTLYPSMFFLILNIALIFIFAPYLPSEVGWENGPLEDLQALLLFLSGIIALIYSFQVKAFSKKIFWLSIMIIWFILVLRELSWGATLLSPQSIDPINGYSFDSNELPYYRQTIIGVAIFGVLSLLGLCYSYKFLWHSFTSGTFPWTFFIFAVIINILAAGAEGHMISTKHFWEAYHIDHQIVEEWFELLSYMYLTITQYQFKKHVCQFS